MMPLRKLRYHSAIKVAIAYLIFSLLWIFISDEVLFALVDDITKIAFIQTIKGWIFVSISAFLIYFLLLRELKKLEQAFSRAKQAEEQYETLVHSATSGIIIAKNNKILYANPYTFSLIGKKESELIGQPLESIIQSVDEDDFYFLKSLNLIKLKGFATALLNKSNGEKAFIEINTTTIKINNSDAILLFFSDISDMVKSQVDFLRQKRFYEQTFMQSASALMIFDSDGSLLFMNNSFRRVFQLQQTEFDNFNLFESSIVESNGLFDRFRDTFNGKQGLSFQSQFGFEQSDNRLLTKEFDHNHYKWTVFPIFDEHDIVKNVVLNIEDISKRIKDEEIIKKQTAMLKAIIDNIPNGAVYLFDQDLRFLVVGGRALKVSTWDASQIIGKSIYDLGNQMLIDALEENYNKVFDGEPSNFEAEMYGAYYDISTYPIKNENGKIIFGLSIAIDISQRKKVELEIIQLNESLEEKVKDRTFELEKMNNSLHEEIEERINAEEELMNTQEELRNLLDREKELNEMKSNFVSMVMHEFRTPLTIIQSSTYLINEFKESCDKEMIDKHIHRIHDTVQDLGILLDELLYLGRSSSRSVLKKEFDVLPIINEIITDHKNIFKREIVFEIQNNLESFIISSDKNRIIRIFRNIINNACKYSNDKVLVRLKLFTDYFEILIIDNGIGIPKNEIEYLYEPFHRCSNVSGIKGTGLGLSIVNKAVDELEGKIECVTEEKKGTAFTIRLPKF